MSFPLWTLGPIVGPLLGYGLGWGLLDHFDTPVAPGTSRFSLGIFAFGGAIVATHCLRFVERNTVSWQSRSLGVLAVTIPFLMPALLGVGDYALRRSLDRAIDLNDASSIQLYIRISIDPRGPARLASALKQAIRQRKFGAARALLDAGADPNRVSKLDPHSALYRAMLADADTEFFEKLLEAKAAFTESEREATATRDFLPVETADRVIVATIRTHWLRGKRKAVYEAARVGDRAAVEQATAVTGVDVFEPSPLGVTILQVLASDEVNFPLIDWLLEQGARPEVPSHFGYSAIRWAVIRQNESLLEKFVSRSREVPWPDVFAAYVLGRARSLTFFRKRPGAAAWWEGLPGEEIRKARQSSRISKPDFPIEASACRYR